MNLDFLTIWKETQSSLEKTDSVNDVEVYDKHFSLLRRISSGEKKCRAMATSPSGRQTAIVEPGEIIVEGEHAFRIESERIQKHGGNHIEFSADNRFLWVTQNCCGAEPNGWVAVIDTQTRKVAWDSPGFFTDGPRQKDSLLLSPHPTGIMVLWIVGFELVHRYYMRFAGGSFEYTLESQTNDSESIEFNRDGSRYLTTNNDTLWLKQFRSGEVLGMLHFSDTEDWHAVGASEESFSQRCGFISERYGLVETNDPRLLVVDLETMSVVENHDFCFSHSSASGELVRIEHRLGKRHFTKWRAIE